MKKEISFLDNTLPVLDPVIAIESDDRGWRGLTADGEVMEVRSRNGYRVEVPEGDVIVLYGGKLIGRRAIEPRDGIDISEYLKHYDLARKLHSANMAEEALTEATKAMLIAPTWRARFNHSQILLACGLWPEGFAEHALCEREPVFQRPNTAKALAVGMRQWQGESIKGKRLLLLHDHGFGDTIMTLRYISRLLDMDADVVLMVPPELRSIARQCAPIVDDIGSNADYFCTMLGLLGVLQVMPEDVTDDTPYLAADPDVPDQRKLKKSIGVAWSVGKFVDGEYPREIPLAMLVEKFGSNANLVSLQIQDCEQAHALGVRHSQFRDFNELAALMMKLDRIVSVDTAALHLAGAIGHPNVTGLLSHWHSWRWQAKWYDVKLACQTSPGDWASALAQV